MKKLLHERLREYGSKCHADYAEWLKQRHANELADEIEKYYIPRPRFEDGEPVQTSDMEEIGGLATCRVYTDGSWKFNPDKYEDERNPKPWDEQQGRQCDFIKRPEPKVLDADGVPCKKGETVWSLVDSTKWEIIDIHPTEPRIAVRQLDIGKDVSGGWFLASGLTHREPDSLKKAVNDLGELLNFPMCDDIKLDKVEEVYNRLTAIMERDYERK